MSRDQPHATDFALLLRVFVAFEQGSFLFQTINVTFQVVLLIAQFLELLRNLRLLII